MYTKEELDFAYKYPFSEEARSVIKSIDAKSVEQMYLITGKARLEEALETGGIEYRETNYGKLELVIGYAYARMLISSIKSASSITRYANAEAKRAAEALEKDSEQNVVRVARELGIDARRDNGFFALGLAQFLANAPIDQDSSLANQRLSNGMVLLDRHQLIRVLQTAISKAVSYGLPVKTSTIPKIVIEYAKGVRMPAQKAALASGPKSLSWIDRLLQTPIPDCRHRTVNLILAPYLVNVKGMEVDKATETISNYIAMCKTLNPDTRITDRYIRYQCDYAKKKGTRPLSLQRARNELGGGIDFVALLGETETVK